MSGNSLDYRAGRGLNDDFFNNDKGGYGVDALRAFLPAPRRGGGGASLVGSAGGVLLNDNRYGPGNRPYWALNKTRFPFLIKDLNKKPDMGICKQVSSLYQALTG